jgi:hypothetical protein
VEQLNRGGSGGRERRLTITVGGRNRQAQLGPNTRPTREDRVTNRVGQLRRAGSIGHTLDYGAQRLLGYRGRAVPDSHQGLLHYRI